MKKLQKIVHFDLKGAPPKLHYLEQVFHCIKSWGATGVLLEWEDTFPYHGNINHLGSECNSGGDEMYTAAEVSYIFQICQEIDLEVIQLVQTIGHMEFVLKHPCHEHLREYARSPSIICPDKQVSKELVKLMVMQALALQPDAKYFHIGADEVCHIAQCEDCLKKIKRTYPLDHWCIYLDYIRDLVWFIKQQRPNITILMWDDMIRAMSPNILEGYRDISEIVQLVVWNYGVPENFQFPPDMWPIYKKYFPNVWAGSAFKGANESSQLVSPVSRYVHNQEAWIREIGIAKSQVFFVGVIFTGWSRFDHFATLCELLPASLNSLANCIKCFDGNTLANHKDLHRENTLPDEQWPGKAVAECVRNVAILHEGYLRVSSGDLRTTWLNIWQLQSGFLNMFQVDNIENYVNKLSVELSNQKQIALIEMSKIYGPRTRTEWLHTHFGTMEGGFTVVQHMIRCARRYDPRSGEFYGRTSANIENLPSTVGRAPLTAGHSSMASSVTTHGPSMVAHSSSMAAYSSSMAAHSSSMAAYSSSMAAHSSPMATHSSSMAAHGPLMAAHDPSMVAHGFPMDARGSSMVAQVPSMVAQRPSMVAHRPSLVAQVPSMAAHLPSTTALMEDVPSTVAYVPLRVHDVP